MGVYFFNLFHIDSLYIYIYTDSGHKAAEDEINDIHYSHRFWSGQCWQCSFTASPYCASMYFNAENISTQRTFLISLKSHQQISPWHIIRQSVAFSPNVVEVLWLRTGTVFLAQEDVEISA